MRSLITAAIIWAISADVAFAGQPLFVFDSKSLAPSKMDIVMRETKRLPRASLLAIDVKSVGSSVGSSFFILCGVRRLAKIRGDYRYIVKIEDHRTDYRMLVGFLNSREEDPKIAGQEFADAPSSLEVIDLEQFAPICDAMK